MSEAMNERESVQTQTTNLSEKVTPPLLDRMYNNFVKITDWVVKGKESKYPLPKALAGLFDAAEQNTNEVAELKSLVTTLQNNLIDKEQRITALDGALQNVNATLKQLVDVANAQPQQAPVAPEPVVATPAPQPAPVPVDDELVDLDDVTDVQDDKAGAEPTQVSPNEQAIKVSAEAVGAGNIDPASYQALDAEIGALLG